MTVTSAMTADAAETTVNVMSSVETDLHGSANTVTPTSAWRERNLPARPVPAAKIALKCTIARHVSSARRKRSARNAATVIAASRIPTVQTARDAAVRMVLLVTNVKSAKIAIRITTAPAVKDASRSVCVSCVNAAKIAQPCVRMTTVSFAWTVQMDSVYHATNVRSMPPSAACATIFAEIVQSPFAGAAKHAANVHNCVWNATAFVRNAVRSGATPATFVRTA